MKTKILLSLLLGFFLITPFAIQAQADLSGVWNATGYQCPAGTYHQEQVQITNTQPQISATKLIGDDCVPAGNVTFSGVFNSATQLYNITWTTGFTYSPACCTTSGTLSVITNDSLVGYAGGTEVVTFVRQTNSLPLNLLSFTGTLQHSNALLNWQTINEINTQSFTVERSANGTSFTPLGSVPATDGPGMNNYSYTDTKPLEANNYYRLKMYDKDGAFTYSRTVLLNNGGGAFALQVQPNPATNTAMLRFNSLTVGKYSVTVASVDGKAIKHIEGVAAAGANTLQMDISGLARGVYMVTFTSGDGTRSMKLVKE